MASKSLFKSLVGKLIPNANTVNEAGGVAYSFSNEQMLAQYAATGCLNSTFYASAEEQLQIVLDLSRKLDATFIAQTAIYARQQGFMKDLPALLCAILSVKAPDLLVQIFDCVIDDARMLRNFVQIVRSGVAGRKSFGTRIKRLIVRWLDARSDEQLFRASVGNDPSLADVIKMVHPKPATNSRAALYAHLVGRTPAANSPWSWDDLPQLVKDYEFYKRDQTNAPPDVPFQMLTALPLGESDWKTIAANAPWQMTRMNLNTFARHGVFTGARARELTRTIAERLRDAEAIRRSKVFPYQLMTAYAQVDPGVPAEVREALQDAMEIALANVPDVRGQVYVLPDVSGSMQSPVTGHRVGATTVVRCVDIAALVAASMLRKNPRTEVLAFSDHVVPCMLNARDSVMTNAQKLSSLPSGGTNCSAPLRELNRQHAQGNLVIYVSDNESWVDTPHRAGRGTATMEQWMEFKARNPRAKLVCIDIQPYGSTQAQEHADILNIGGFSDRVFDVIAKFADGTLSGDHWVGVIKEVTFE